MSDCNNAVNEHFAINFIPICIFKLQFTISCQAIFIILISLFLSSLILILLLLLDLIVVKNINTIWNEY